MRILRSAGQYRSVVINACIIQSEYIGRRLPISQPANPQKKDGEAKGSIEWQV